MIPIAGYDKEIYVKDESYRFGLNAFKVLGGSYVIGNYIAKKLGVEPVLKLLTMHHRANDNIVRRAVIHIG